MKCICFLIFFLKPPFKKWVHLKLQGDLNSKYYGIKVDATENKLCGVNWIQQAQYEVQWSEIFFPIRPDQLSLNTGYGLDGP